MRSIIHLIFSKVVVVGFTSFLRQVVHGKLTGCSSNTREIPKVLKTFTLLCLTCTSTFISTLAIVSKKLMPSGKASISIFQSKTWPAKAFNNPSINWFLKSSPLAQAHSDPNTCFQLFLLPTSADLLMLIKKEPWREWIWLNSKKMNSLSILQKLVPKNSKN